MAESASAPACSRTPATRDARSCGGWTAGAAMGRESSPSTFARLRLAARSSDARVGFLGSGARGPAARAAAEEGGLADAGSARVAAPVLGDVGGAAPRGEETRDGAAVGAQHLGVDRDAETAEREADVVGLPQREVEDRKSVG